MAYRVFFAASDGTYTGTTNDDTARRGLFSRDEAAAFCSRVLPGSSFLATVDSLTDFNFLQSSSGVFNVAGGEALPTSDVWLGLQWDGTNAQ
ncbi:unnamed protein product [Amoebophrya sp. A25]|nr:unnamed protein product [Amoebophrya sp. A25]|eukprot:GSA25T00026177001.1